MGLPGARQSGVRTGCGPVKRDTSWMAQALCQDDDGEMWFARAGSPEEREAKRVCGLCPVRAGCEAHAKQGAEAFGVWGGRNFGEKRETAAERRARVDAAVDALIAGPVVGTQWALPLEQKERRALLSKLRKRAKRAAMTPEEHATFLAKRRVQERLLKERRASERVSSNGES